MNKISKNSITKNKLWSLLLRINQSLLTNTKQDTITIDENFLGANICFSYDRRKDLLFDINFQNDDLAQLLKIFLPIILCKQKNYIFGHLAQSLDGYIATQSGESKYISGKQNLEHIHRLRAISDIIIVGAKTFIEDKPKLTTRLVKGSNPDIYIFDPKKTINNKNMKIFHNKKDLISVINKQKNLKIYVEGGGKTISYFLKYNLLNRLHLCVCPIILGGGRASIYQDKNIKLSSIKEYQTSYYKMGSDLLCDLKIK